MKKQKNFTVFLWNMTEDVWPFIEAISDKNLQNVELVENDLYADREVFSLPAVNVDLYITPTQVLPQFIGHVQSVIGEFSLETHTPLKQTASLCLDLLQDKKLIKYIEHQVKKSGGALILRSYSASEQFLELALYFQKKGLKVQTPEAPQESAYWTTNFYGSKSGIRQTACGLSRKLKGVTMPEGKIVMSRQEAIKIAYSYYSKGGVVIKTNKGHSGAGVLIYGPGSLPTQFQEFVAALKNELEANLYWSRFPIVIEEYILPDKTVAGGNPNVEFFLNPEGQVEHLYSCGMRVDKHGVFEGVEIGEIALPTKLEAAMAASGKALAGEYAKNGYRGYFDLDFIVGVDKKLYLAESNVRRTGGTYVFYLAKSLFHNTGFAGHYFASTVLTLPKPITLENILLKLGDCVYNSKKQEGIIVMSANVLSVGKLMYVVVAKTKKRALALEVLMKTRVL